MPRTMRSASVQTALLLVRMCVPGTAYIHGPPGRFIQSHSVSVASVSLAQCGAQAATGLPIQITPGFPGLRRIHRDPDIYIIDNFLSKKACEGFRSVGPIGEKDGSAKRVESKVFDAGLSAGGLLRGALSAAGAIVPEMKSASMFLSETLGQRRKSTTWFLKYGSAGPLIQAALNLLPSCSLENFEEPQVVRYEKGDFFDFHQDFLPPAQARKAGNGQRLATILVGFPICRKISRCRCVSISTPGIHGAHRKSRNCPNHTQTHKQTIQQHILVSMGTLTCCVCT